MTAALAMYMILYALAAVAFWWTTLVIVRDRRQTKRAANLHARKRAVLTAAYLTKLEDKE